MSTFLFKFSHSDVCHLKLNCTFQPIWVTQKILKADSKNCVRRGYAVYPDLYNHIFGAMMA